MIPANSANSFLMVCLTYMACPAVGKGKPSQPRKQVEQIDFHQLETPKTSNPVA